MKKISKVIAAVGVLCIAVAEVLREFGNAAEDEKLNNEFESSIDKYTIEVKKK